MPQSRSTSHGFSLVEVVIALGIVAVAVSAVLALLPTLVRQGGDSADLLRAQRFPDLVRAAVIRRLNGASLSEFAARTAPVGAATTCQLVAARDGLELKDEKAAGEDESYFLVELWQFSTPPLEPSDNLLPLQVRVSWPYRLPGAMNPSARADRSEFNFAVGVDQ